MDAQKSGQVPAIIGIAMLLVGAAAFIVAHSPNCKGILGAAQDRRNAIGAGGRKDERGVLWTDDAVRRVVLQGNVAYLAAGGDGLILVDVERPSAPVRLSAFKAEGDAHDVAVRDHVVYVASDLRGLSIVDVHGPRRPLHLADHDRPGHARPVCVGACLSWVEMDS